MVQMFLHYVECSHGSDFVTLYVLAILPQIATRRKLYQTLFELYRRKDGGDEGTIIKRSRLPSVAWCHLRRWYL
jgi:hypothetical protein